MSLERPKVLVVDDEAELGLALQRRLRRTCDIVFVTSARDAKAKLAADSFDVVLCDLMMPETTGLQLHAELSASHPEVARKMIFMSGGVFTTGMRDALEKVDNVRVDKPIDMATLMTVMKDLIAR